MKATDLNLKDLLEYQSDSGIIRLLNHRVLLFDSVALGLLHKELIDSVGQHATRSLLTKFGYAHGWQIAEGLREDLPDLLFNDIDTGPQLHTMQGLLTHISLERSTDENGNLLITAQWKDSYEVEQHHLHFGETDEPVCWITTAFTSGYASNRLGREFFFIEKECCAKGDPNCRVEGRSPEDWGEKYAQDLNYFRKDAIDTLLPEINRKLKSLDQKLQKRKTLIVQGENEKLYTELSARSPAMRKVIDLAGRIAGGDSSIVISGESGVGKEKIARLIHSHSSRADYPFVALNCGALTESLLESELFGYAKGSFTGATSDRVGLFDPCTAIPPLIIQLTNCILPP